MKSFILGLIMMFTLTVCTSSIGFATPIDAKIENTFNFDEMDSSVDSIKFEKVAETSYRYDLLESIESNTIFTLSIDNYLVTHRYDIDYNKKEAKKIKEKISIDPNLHLIVPWQIS